MASEPGAADYQPPLRLHKWSWVFAVAGGVRQLIFPLIAILIFGARREDDWVGTPIIIAVFTLLVLARALWHQWTYRYGFGPSGLVIREGVIHRNLRQIEYARIENIDTERGPLHQLLNVARVRVQTSTGGKPEAQIDVLGLDAVQEMRERVFAKSGPAPQVADAPREPPLLRLPPAELVRYGLIDNRGIVIVAAGVGLLQQMGFFRYEDRGFFERWYRELPIADVAALGVAMQVALALIAIVAILVALRILSVVLALITLHDFTLTRQHGDLRARYGLLTNVALTLRTRRIQAVHQVESVLHRLFGRVSLDVDLAGDGGGDAQQRNQERMKTRWLAPVCPTRAAPALIAAALPAFDPAMTPAWRPLAPGARARIFRRSALVSLVVVAGVGGWFLREGALLLVPVVLALAWLHAHLTVKYTSWALERDVLLFRSGWLTRRLTIVPRDRVQSLDVSASPFDRRWRMASVTVDTAGGRMRSAGVRIRYLPDEIARTLAAELYVTVSG